MNNGYFRVNGILPIRKDIVLIRETEGYYRNSSVVYLYNARLDQIIYQIDKYTRCDIFHRLSNGNIILRFDFNFLEIWDFNLIQCNTKIFAFEVSSIKEIDNKRLVLISEGGIQIMNLKF